MCACTWALAVAGMIDGVGLCVLSYIACVYEVWMVGYIGYGMGDT